jgi:hypothetical protein
MVRNALAAAVAAAALAASAFAQKCTRDSKCPSDSPCCGRTSPCPCPPSSLANRRSLWRLRCRRLLPGRMRPDHVHHLRLVRAKPHLQERHLRLQRPQRRPVHQQVPRRQLQDQLAGPGQPRPVPVGRRCSDHGRGHRRHPACLDLLRMVRQDLRHNVHQPGPGCRHRFHHDVRRQGRNRLRVHWQRRGKRPVQLVLAGCHKL